MKPEEIIEALEHDDDAAIARIHDSIARENRVGAAGEDQARRDARAAVIQAVSIRQMRRLDKAATKLTWVGIGVAAASVLLAAVQLILAATHK